MALNARKQNQQLAEQVEQVAQNAGVGVTRFQTNKGNHDGWHSYAIYETPNDGRPFGTRSKRVTAFVTRRHSRWSEPSISGEESALRFILRKLTGG